MIAEAKLRLFSKMANLLNVWYSFLMIVGSLAEAANIFSILHYEFIFASASVAILASSTFLVSGTLERKANDFRDCYLELQRIWNSNVAENEKLKRYADALARYPNHSSRDDADMRYDAWWRGATLYDTRGEAKPSKGLILSAVVRKFFFWTLVSLVFFAPLFLAPHFISASSNG